MFFYNWSGRRGSNSRHLAPKASALPLRYAPKMGVGNTQRPGTRWNASWRMNSLCCQHRSGPGLIPASHLRLRDLRNQALPGGDRSARHHRSLLIAASRPSAPPLRCWPPSFRGVMSFCRPATYHGIEPPPFLPSLDRRAGIEPALSLLVAGGDPGFARLVRCARTR